MGSSTPDGQRESVAGMFVASACGRTSRPAWGLRRRQPCCRGAEELPQRVLRAPTPQHRAGRPTPHSGRCLRRSRLRRGTPPKLPPSLRDSAVDVSRISTHLSNDRSRESIANGPFVRVSICTIAAGWMQDSLARAVPRNSHSVFLLLRPLWILALSRKMRAAASNLPLAQRHRNCHDGVPLQP
jgi:hypothetical protein